MASKRGHDASELLLVGLLNDVVLPGEERELTAPTVDAANLAALAAKAPSRVCAVEITSDVELPAMVTARWATDCVVIKCEDERLVVRGERRAEIVADELRRQIIDGELSDGDLLPRQEILVEQFNVSLVSLREALRILETEGLVSVRRGNRGGAVVHAPAKASAASCVATVSGHGAGQSARTAAKACRTSGQGRRSLRRATLANSFSTCTLITPPSRSRARAASERGSGCRAA